MLSGGTEVDGSTRDWRPLEAVFSAPVSYRKACCGGDRAELSDEEA